MPCTRFLGASGSFLSSFLPFDFFSSFSPFDFFLSFDSSVPFDFESFLAFRSSGSTSGSSSRCSSSPFSLPSPQAPSSYACCRYSSSLSSSSELEPPPWCSFPPYAASWLECECWHAVAMGQRAHLQVYMLEYPCASLHHTQALTKTNGCATSDMRMGKVTLALHTTILNICTYIYHKNSTPIKQQVGQVEVDYIAAHTYNILLHTCTQCTRGDSIWSSISQDTR